MFRKLCCTVMVVILALSISACGGKNIDPSLFDGKFKCDTTQVVFHGNKCTEYHENLGSVTYKFHIEDKYFVTEQGEKKEFYFDSKGNLNLKLKDKFVMFEKVW